MSAEQFSKVLLDRMQAVLKPKGYRKKGSTFHAEQDDVVLLVQLQKSRKTTKDVLVATVNLGAFSRRLSGKLGLVVEEPTIADCHWWQRIGFLLPEQQDKWWEVHSITEAITAAAEIGELLEREGCMALERVSSTARLRALWDSGQSPGLTEVQRQRYLSALDT